MAFEAMDVYAWRSLEAAETLTAADRLKLSDLKAKAKRLLQACGIKISGAQWLAAVRGVRGEGKDNRLLWAGALRGPVASQDLEELYHELRPLIVFYIAFMDGTGDVERLLGRHAGFLERHGSEGCIAEACLEVSVWADAVPAASQEPDERMMFTKAGGKLQFTEFSKRCQELWISRFGRRFGCYKLRKDKGVSQEKIMGTQQAVKDGQVAAVKQLLKLSKGGTTRTTITGHDRQRVAEAARSRAPLPASKAILAFRSWTGRKKAEKSSSSVWTGIWKKKCQ